MLRELEDELIRQEEHSHEQAREEARRPGRATATGPAVAAEQGGSQPGQNWPSKPAGQPEKTTTWPTQPGQGR